MRQGHEILYLGHEDIEALRLGPDEMWPAIEAMFVQKAAGHARNRPKLALIAPSGTGFLASAGVMGEPALAGVKWVGVAANEGRDLPHIAGLVILSDAVTGMPLAVMDARRITALRTAAISAIAARRLARPDSAAIGFVACGLQARAHLEALLPHFPLTHVRAYSRRPATAEIFAAHARGLGLDARVVDDASDAITGVDIVVSSTPVVPRTPPMLDAGRLSSGAFACMVDLGISWREETMGAIDLAFTDDREQAASAGLTFPRDFDGEIADLVVGEHAGRDRSPSGREARTALVFAGIGLADTAAAALIYETARREGKGHVLPL